MSSLVSVHTSRLPRAVRVPGIPIVVYHGLSEDLNGVPYSEQKYWIRPAQFSRHLDIIRQIGCKVISMHQVVHGSPNSDTEVVITFDDGLISDYAIAFPALQASGCSAEFFVSTSAVGQQGYSNWDQLSEMSRAGMSIQSHGHSHVDLKSLSREQVIKELETSKKTLEDKLGVEVKYLAAPFGCWNSTVLDEALRLGYEAVCTARSIPARFGGRKIDRVVLHRETTSNEFVEYLGRDPVRYIRRVSRSLLYRWPLRVLYQTKLANAAPNSGGQE